MSDKAVDNSFGIEIEAVVNLMTGRCVGAVNDDSVEDAISKLLSRSVPHRPVPPIAMGHGPSIVQDMGCYDGDDDFQHDLPCTDSSNAAIRNKPTLEPAEKSNDNQQECHEFQQEIPCTGTSISAIPNKTTLEMTETWDDIPLGHIAFKLMQTFGDGPKPRPEATSAALLGTRQLLHMAIKDARALRRKMKVAFLKAKSQVMGRDHFKVHNRTKRNSTSAINITETDEKVSYPPSAIDAELTFQAFGGISKISFDPPCGFDEEQLEKLFPEEMHAYCRWKSMHQAAIENSNNDILIKKQGGVFSGSAEEQDVENDDDDVVVENNKADPNEWGGYLQGRLSQFDARTELMKDEFYLKFSEVRRGSFLPPSYLNQEEKIWEKIRKENRPKGRLNTTLSTWETLPAQHVPFLHWLGFSPRSALPLPSEATTHALAFLAYDFFGKIVEKAIFLRCFKDNDKTHRKTTRDGRIILELQADEQLSREDIEIAMNDSTLSSKTLYRVSGDHGLPHEAAQLYFGPGFEDRLEVELDQIMLKKIHDKEISEEENNIRILEDDLFENLQKLQPVKLTSIMTLRSDGVGPRPSTTPKKRILGTLGSTEQKRPRGRPPKQTQTENENKSTELPIDHES